MYAAPYLEKYKGKTTRHTCPECGMKECFTLYVDGNTHQPINKRVGKCNRESKCGYHYTPKQFFIDNPNVNETTRRACDLHYSKPINSPSPRGEGSGVRSLSVGTIPFTYVERSASYKSNFVRFLCEFMTTEQIKWIGDNYAIGATKNKEIIFWQIDITGKVRTGKIMQYNPETGKRIKHESGAIDWVHNKLKQTKQLPEDFNLQQCFFGEHLLKLYPTKTVAIVESEKSAIIASVQFPDLIWIAAGNINGLSVDKCQVLNNRKVILFPDLGAYNKWNEKVSLLRKECNCKIKISNFLEIVSTPEAKAKGLDIADYMISQLSNKQQVKIKVETQVHSRFTPGLQSMIEKNKSLEILIEKLQLVEV